MSNTRRTGTWGGQPLRLGANRQRARSLPRQRQPDPGQAVIARQPRQPPGGGLRVRIPPRLLAPRRAGSSRSGAGP